ncbi:MAG: N-acylneuraminate cytidylyltransferase [Ruminococcus sp.]|jgi:N-acylneuraminate cytidylyltransferase|nr:N-acylneuraminate cytidylyltransferase [Ruminococcus sp.]
MTVAFIPVRGGSKSIPLKNIKPIAGKPLIYWTAKAACDCEFIDRVFIATDSEAIKETVVGFGFEKLQVIGRSPESATDTASTEYGMLEFANEQGFDNIVLIQATSPLLAADDLTHGFELFYKADTDSVLSVVLQKRFVWDVSKNDSANPVNYDFLNRPRRQEFGGFYVENGAFYITSREALRSSGCRISGNIKAYEMSPESYIELDEPDDWAVVESFLLKRLKYEKCADIKMFITDCDGTLTDGGMYYGTSGEVMKKFNTRDGAGIRLLKESGIITAIITGEKTDIVTKRAQKLGIDEVILGASDKLAEILKLCEKHGVKLSEVAFIGDDLNDITAISNVGLGISVGSAVSQVKSAAKFVTTADGGNGAVREAAELVISLLKNCSV